MIALIIIYKHWDENKISKCEELYKTKFSNIFHLVPYYKGIKNNIITVYEHTDFIEGFIAQGYKIIKTKGNFQHLFFITEDKILDVLLNETNYKDILKINDFDSFIPALTCISKCEDKRITDKAKNYSLEIKGLEIKNEFPTLEQMVEIFSKNNYIIPYLTADKFYKIPCRSDFPKGLEGYYIYLKRKKETKKQLDINNPVELSFPLITGSIDMFVLSGHDIKLFSHYCGLFAASQLIGELAIPTAMLLACQSIQTEATTRSIKQ